MYLQADLYVICYKLLVCFCVVLLYLHFYSLFLCWVLYIQSVYMCCSISVCCMCYMLYLQFVYKFCVVYTLDSLVSVLYSIYTDCSCVVCYIYTVYLYVICCICSLVSAGGNVDRIHSSDHYSDSRGYMLQSVLVS